MQIFPCNDPPFTPFYLLETGCTSKNDFISVLCAHKPCFFGQNKDKKERENIQKKINK